MNNIQKLVERLNEKMIHPEKDTDLLLNELKNIGISFIETDDTEHWEYNLQKKTKEPNKQKENINSNLITCIDDNVQDGAITKGEKYEMLFMHNDIIAIINDINELDCYHISFFKDFK